MAESAKICRPTEASPASPSRFRVTVLNSGVEIETKRLILRALKSDDVYPLHVCMRDEETMRYWSCRPHSTVERTTEFVDATIASAFNGHLDFAVCLRELEGPASGKPTLLLQSKPPVIGKAGIYDGVDIGFIFNKKFWGKGYAHEALDAIIWHFWVYEFPALTLEPDSSMCGLVTLSSSPSFELDNGRITKAADRLSITADVDPRNEPCLKLLKKLGFVQTGYGENTFKTHLGWCDSVYLELKRPGVVR